MYVGRTAVAALERRAGREWSMVCDTLAAAFSSVVREKNLEQSIKKEMTTKIYIV